MKTIRFALCALAVLASIGARAQPARLPALAVPQDWSAADKATWYTLSQGSRLIPHAWLKALEQPDNGAPFLDPSHIARYRYLMDAPAQAGALPVGFTLDTQKDTRFGGVSQLRWKAGQSSREPWVGMNCAACHTNEMTFNNVRLRIEGAPTLADFQGFMGALNRSLVVTQDDPGKWVRFAKAVLKKTPSPTEDAMLKSAYTTLLSWQQRVERANATDLAYGFGRLDAFGNIFNKVGLRANETGFTGNPADAPVSYPFLWNIHQHDRVQWNGIAENGPMAAGMALGALGRNVGEVTGVFADLTLKRRDNSLFGGVSTYTTSAHMTQLAILEKQITRLKPPVWPAVFPPINADRWELGKAVFHRGAGSCASCHQVIARDNITEKFKAKMSPIAGTPDAVGTDPWMACNAFTYTAPTGLLEGTPQKYFKWFGDAYGPSAPLAQMLSTVATGSIMSRLDQIAASALLPLLQQETPMLARAETLQLGKRAFGVPASGSDALVSRAPIDPKQARLQECLGTQNALLAYKGRPLNGIWATAPFLHNGSVANLYDLLLLPELRPTSFKVGTREFDPQRVGFVTEHSAPEFHTLRSQEENAFQFKVLTDAGAPIAGNSNLGHDYGNGQLTEEERWALVEYMKAVGGRRVGNRVLP